MELRRAESKTAPDRVGWEKRNAADLALTRATRVTVPPATYAADIRVATPVSREPVNADREVSSTVPEPKTWLRGRPAQLQAT